jgi:hypothetical protein
MKHIILALVILSSSVAMSTETKKKTNKTAAKPVEKVAERPAPKAASKPVFERQYGLAGCGLGSVVMGKGGGQVSAATTNGTSFNQSFAISAGSLNCLDSATAAVASRMDQFIIVNHSQLQGDIAKGNGETISAISSYLGCSKASKEIGESLKTNYSTIFTKGNAANEITDSIINVILSNPELSSKCNNLVG